MPGLVSVSFRQLTPEEILVRMTACGLDSIEWGGDVHVPAGDIATATRVRALSEAARVRIHAYGSYYRIGASDPADFAAVAASAEALDAPIIRVWAYTQNRPAVDHDTYARIVSDARRICDTAPDRLICMECHHGTLTEDYTTALDFIRAVARPNLRTYFQPNQFRDLAYNLAAARALAHLCHGVHTFSWSGNQKFPLDTPPHDAYWAAYIAAIREPLRESQREPARPAHSAPDPAPEFLLEFMHDGRPESLPAAAATLRAWLA